ncbi:hypothetical protein H4219_004371 [Mycoemilia scoparia]|uniref:Uncharacterized protein n=1 Tax=Mycoemilia scoparia TaxID=417184 RepID=A0A9W7ZXM2_9FUNG|nr:hypothetical protein H4219_004371 [Mycoemilia scoparia]
MSRRRDPEAGGRGRVATRSSQLTGNTDSIEVSESASQQQFTTRNVASRGRRVRAAAAAAASITNRSRGGAQGESARQHTVITATSSTSTGSSLNSSRRQASTANRSTNASSTLQTPVSSAPPAVQPNISSRPQRRAAQVANAHLAAQLQSRRQQQQQAQTNAQSRGILPPRPSPRQAAIAESPSEQRQQNRRAFAGINTTAAATGGRISPSLVSPRWQTSFNTLNTTPSSGGRGGGGGGGIGQFRSPSPTHIMNQSSPIFEAREPYLVRGRGGARGSINTTTPPTARYPVSNGGSQNIRLTPTAGSTIGNPNSSLRNQKQIEGSIQPNKLPPPPPQFGLTPLNKQASSSASSTSALSYTNTGNVNNNHGDANEINKGNVVMDQVVIYLRKLCRMAIKDMMYSTAIVWGERLVRMTGDLDDLEVLVKALMANGQYRQADQWLQLTSRQATPPPSKNQGLQPPMSHFGNGGGDAPATSTGLFRFKSEDIMKHSGCRYLASIIATRIGRPQDTMKFLDPVFDFQNIDDSQDCYEEEGDDDKVMKYHSGKCGINVTPTPAHFNTKPNNAGGGTKPENECHQNQQTINTIIKVRSFNQLSRAMYLKGLALVQSYTIEGYFDTSKIMNEQQQQLDVLFPLPFTQNNPAATKKSQNHGSNPDSNNNALPGSSQDDSGSYGSEDDNAQMAKQAIRACWVRSVIVDPRCWEAWISLRLYGLLSPKEEILLIESIDWKERCQGYEQVAEFMMNYMLATSTMFAATNNSITSISSTGDKEKALQNTANNDSSSSSVVERSISYLIEKYPGMINRDPTILIPIARKSLEMGRPQKTINIISKVLDDLPFHNSSLALKVTSLLMKGDKPELFKLAHYIADYHGVSALGASYNQASVTNASLVLGNTNVGGGGYSGLLNDPAAGGLSGMSKIVGPATVTSRLKCGLSSVPIYPCMIGGNGLALADEMAESSGSGALVPNPSSAEAFGGTTLAWYAIGCYYLCCAAQLIYESECPGSKYQSSSGSGMFMRGFPIFPTLTTLGGGSGGGDTNKSGDPDGDGGGMRIGGPSGKPLSPAAERALTEARRWLAKCTWTASRSSDAWLAFAQTFILSRDWESASKALYTAVSMSGLGEVINTTGFSSINDDDDDDDDDDRFLNSASSTANNIPLPPLPESRIIRTQVAYTPLVSLGIVYLRMGDLEMSWACFDEVARQLTGWGISIWTRALQLSLSTSQDSSSSTSANISGWRKIRDTITSVVDPLLINELGTLYYQQKKYSQAMAYFEAGVEGFINQSRFETRVLSGIENVIGGQNTVVDSKTKFGQKSSSSSSVAPACTINTDKQPIPKTIEGDVGSGGREELMLTIRLNLATVYRKIGKYEKAITEFDQILEKDPNLVDGLLGAAFSRHMYVSSLPDSSGILETTRMKVFLLDEAIEMYHQALALRPNDSMANDLLTVALQQSTTVNVSDSFIRASANNSGAATNLMATSRNQVIGNNSSKGKDIEIEESKGFSSFDTPLHQNPRLTSDDGHSGLSKNLYTEIREFQTPRLFRRGSRSRLRSGSMVRSTEVTPLGGIGKIPGTRFRGGRGGGVPGISPNPFGSESSSHYTPGSVLQHRSNRVGNMMTMSLMPETPYYGSNSSGGAGGGNVHDESPTLNPTQVLGGGSNDAGLLAQIPAVRPNPLPPHYPAVAPSHSNSSNGMMALSEGEGDNVEDGDEDEDMEMESDDMEMD